MNTTRNQCEVMSAGLGLSASSGKAAPQQPPGKVVGAYVEGVGGGVSSFARRHTRKSTSEIPIPKFAIPAAKK